MTRIVSAQSPQAIDRARRRAAKDERAKAEWNGRTQQGVRPKDEPARAERNMSRVERFRIVARNIAQQFLDQHDTRALARNDKLAPTFWSGAIAGIVANGGDENLANYLTSLGSIEVRINGYAGMVKLARQDEEN
jgi:hypothetical protein